MVKHLLTIREAAEILGLSVDTLRRWDESGKLVAIRKDGGTHRFYKETDLLLVISDLAKMAQEWAIQGGDIPSSFYCGDSATFQARVIKMENLLLADQKTKKDFSLLTSVAGEIGNNSFDHNIGKWPDMPGVFFGYNIVKGTIVLADRGIGILETLRRVKPSLTNHLDALKTAFTEVLSGRAPEARGNGLKYVRAVIKKSHFRLFFQSGDAELRIDATSGEIRITRSPNIIRGCLAIITF